MTVAQLVRRLRQSVAFDLDPVFGPYPEGGTDEEIAEWTEDALGFLNEAALEIANLIYQTADRVTLTLTAGVGTYPLASPAFSGRVIQPFAVEVDGRRLTNASGGAYGFWTPDELSRAFPTWASDAPGSVSRAVFRGDRLILHPAPSHGGVAYVEGKVGPPLFTLAALDAVPSLPERLHPHIVGLAVYKACKDHAQDGGQFSRLGAMRDEAMAVAFEVQRDNTNAQVGASSTTFTRRFDEVWV